VTLPDRFIGKGNAKAQQSAMKLTELGPRLTLEIFKVEQGVNEGDVLYHKFVQKTPAEAAQIKAKVRCCAFAAAECAAADGAAGR
jgi:ribosome biogenesis protein SSF1/2